ncbi:protein of unknown function [Shewanella benthica]|uniref:Uncharacterized protein n=1 Tax=Shewanella benthica TaxID=43661 RepID=A0A330M8F0_9GAMM|nr:protein of unknown function [Shewanella benthica]
MLVVSRVFFELRHTFTHAKYTELSSLYTNKLLSRSELRKDSKYAR